MTDKVKKRPVFSLFKRKTDNNDIDEPPKSPKPPITPEPVDYKKAQKLKSRPSIVETKMKRLSIGGIRELVQCALCLEVLHNPKMLPCQHTFCLACLLVYVNDAHLFKCPLCNTQIQRTDSKYLSNLPSNLYINSLLELVGKPQNGLVNEQPTSPGPSAVSVELHASSVRCSQCQTVCDASDTSCCDHCKLQFCKICWSQHLEGMQNQIGSILKQLDLASVKLQHKIENYNDRCERLTEQINITTEEKISEIVESKTTLLKEASEMKRSSEMSALALQSSLNEARSVANHIMTSKEPTNDNEKVSTFINLHQNSLQLLTDISRWDVERFVFDKENFCIDLDAATPLEAESDDPLPMIAGKNDPLENEDSLFTHYRSRNFIPHYVWRKTARPGGVGLSPWTNTLYICGMDTHNVLIVERTQAKIISKLSCDHMLCPVHIAFMKSLGEIYVTDKWKHCVHVFSRDGEYLRSIGQKGSRLGMFRSPEGIATDNSQHRIYVVDTGNDRVQVLTPDGKVVDQFGVITKQQNNDHHFWQTSDTRCTELNAPTSVAVTNERVIILDSGNRRVKVYNKQDKNKIFEFGSYGQRKGQFRQPEVLTVDPLGFILIGDSGNSRVQVFKPSGQLVRVFGGLGTEPGKFGWISGIHVTKQLDIIISDTKNHSVNFI